MRETFASRFGSRMALIGVAVGLGNVWRFPYMVGEFGGAAFVIFYVLVVAVIGIPALMAELALGRHTRRGPVGAYAAGRLPFGRHVGWLLFVVVTAAMAYYTAVIGWVLYHALASLVAPLGLRIEPSAILPPDTGFDARSFLLQLTCSGAIILAYVVVLRKGLRAGIERASGVIMPALLVILLLLVIRSLTLPGAMEGVHWYILKFSFADINARVVMAALGHAVFSLSLGGTFMVLYGSYLDSREDLRTTAIYTAAGDTTAGLLAGLAIIPAVFAIGLEPSSGPGLLFATLPRVFETIPGGWLFGLLFFAGLASAAYLSGMAALEALVAGLTDNTNVPRGRALLVMATVVFLLTIPPSINMSIFMPWDLTFGSGMQTLGALLAVLTIGWCVDRSTVLAEIAGSGDQQVSTALIYWIRFGIPTAIVSVGIWWLLTSVFKTATAV